MINYRNETPAYKDVCGTKKFQYSTRPMIMNACPAAQAWVFALILLFFWETVIPVMLISLFFGVRFSFTGEDDLSSANNFMEKAGDMADEVRSEFVG